MVKCTVNLKESYQAWLDGGTLEGADRYWQAKQSAILLVAEAKLSCSGETMEQDFHLASKRFWRAVR